MLPSLLRWMLCGLSAVPLLTCAMVLGPIHRPTAARLMRVWGRLQLVIFGIELTVEDRNGGEYRAPPYVFTLLNQTSLVETFVMLACLPLSAARVFANLEFLLLPLVGWAVWSAGAVMVKRGDPTQARQALERAKRHLAGGDSFYISIEGRRSGGGLQEYRKGPVLLALSSGAPLVPLVAHGAAERMPLGEWRVKPGPIRLTLCEAIPTRGLTPADRDSLVSRLRRLAEQELNSSPEKGRV